MAATASPNPTVFTLSDEIFDEDVEPKTIAAYVERLQASDVYAISFTPQPGCEVRYFISEDDLIELVTDAQMLLDRAKRRREEK